MPERKNELRAQLQQALQNLKRMEEALRENRKRTEAIIASSLDAVVEIDENGTILAWNPKAEEIFGWTAEEALGSRPSETIVPAHYREAHETGLRHFLATGEGPILNKRIELTALHRDGHEFPVEVTVAPIRGPSGYTFIAFMRDISESKRAEEALRFSEARYRALHRDNPTMIATLDSELRMLSVNPTCARQLGYTMDELEGQPVLKLFHEDDRLAVTEQLRLCLRHPDRVYRWQFRKIRKDGKLLWVEELAQAVYDLNGSLNVLVVCQDITARKRTEEALQKSEKKFSKIFHAAPALIGITTLAEGKIIDINETGLKTLGYQHEEMIGRTLLELDTLENPAELDLVVRMLLEQGTVRNYEINFRGRSGERFTGLLSAELIDMNGERYMLGMVQNVTERKRAAEEIEKLNADLAARAVELEYANVELEAFNYSVAHDLRKPLTVINGYCQAIMELCGDTLDERCKGYLQEAYEGTLNMNELITDLLDFSRLAHCEIKPESVELSAMAKEITAELRLADPKRQVTFVIAEGVSAEGDPALLRVVMENLFGNAWKYTGKREMSIIEFGVTEIEGEQTCFVRDNGTGFDMAYAEKLFIPFQRLPGTDEFKGHGIGLATVERVIRRHGGRVWAEGDPGKGATFYFTLSEGGFST
jgi:PAS domain S-box-containing protein